MAVDTVIISRELAGKYRSLGYVIFGSNFKDRLTAIYFERS